MSTGGAVLIVGGVGLAAFIYFRSQTTQQQALAAAAQAANAPTGGGGIGGLTSRVWSQFKSDPLGIEQHKATLNTVKGIATTGAVQVAHTAQSLVGAVKGIF